MGNVTIESVLLDRGESPLSAVRRSYPEEWEQPVRIADYYLPGEKALVNGQIYVYNGLAPSSAYPPDFVAWDKLPENSGPAFFTEGLYIRAGDSVISSYGQVFQCLADHIISTGESLQDSQLWRKIENREDSHGERNPT